ncbi:MAG: ABC transporter permease subunit [Spirochaetaceae bacterium]|jgi:sulfonate transport system permease protein|nr:ABC transporter permease subunit [Spirochaetaceae bacterium]
MRNSILKSRPLKIITPCLIPAAVCALWYVWSKKPDSGLLFPPPAQVVTRTLSMLRSGELLAYVLESSKRAFLGFFLGGAAGFLLGLATGISRLADRLLNTTIQMLRNIPVLALIPLMIVWFGIGEKMKVLLVAFGVFFSVYINTYHGIRAIDKKLLEMGRVYGFSPFSTFINIILPGAAPAVMVGVRLALGIMWLVLIAAETIATDKGIGYMAMMARSLMQMDKVLLSIILYALLGKASDAAAGALERSLFTWRI